MKVKVSPIVITLAIVLVLGSLVFVLRYAKRETLLGLKFKNSTFHQEDLKDSDNDGLKDWEEELYHSDPYNSDTDGDGYLDGEEVNSGHNPLVKAPGDKLAFYPLPLGGKYNVTNKVLGDEVLDSVLNSYLAQKGQYLEDHPEIKSPEDFSNSTKDSTLQEISNRAVTDTYALLTEKANETLKETPSIFEVEILDNDIKLSEDNSLEAIQQYIEAISFLLNSNNFFLGEKASKAVLQALNDGDFAALDELIKDNDDKISQIKEIVVPSSWKDIHKEGLALTIKIRNIFVSFRDIRSDPLKAYLAVQEFDKFTDEWNTLIKEALDLARTQGVELNF